MAGVLAAVHEQIQNAGRPMRLSPAALVPVSHLFENAAAFGGGECMQGREDAFCAERLRKMKRGRRAG